MARWDMFQEMDMLRREIDQAFRGFGLGRALAPSFIPGIGMGDFPRLNLREDEHNFYLEALIPGVEAKDLDLNLMQGTLTLSGERREHETGSCTWHRHERGAGKFMCTIELPTAIDSEKVTAEFRNGVLLVTLPKAESVKAKRISVEAH